MNPSDQPPKPADQGYHYREEIRMNQASPFYQPPKYKADWIRWADETVAFETQREAYEWISSGAYNEIGKCYDGYRSHDPKMAETLAFQLLRLQTIREATHRIYTDIDYEATPNWYMVWVEKIHDVEKNENKVTE
ncbi:hypothetical protein QCD85_18520 [Paenibacillus sp. PsM32]|uniref:hypothetical protein n=1 Tax=Paenibacillus sp. PsM32 TaxID=3030536 RepID=UPI00263B0852|nr:hypothetical protein [Paenibacillus sp. PsM32]MDN4620114.1 hypothetical protein [Paenibacillus sp. PsM32]